MRWTAAVLGWGATAALVVVAVAGNSRLSGPTVLALTDGHGIHAGDGVVVALGALVMVTILVLLRRR